MQKIGIVSLFLLLVFNGCSGQPKADEKRDVQVKTASERASQPATDGLSVIDVFHTDQAFAALRSDGVVVCWGNRQMEHQAEKVEDELKEVVQIYSTASTFAAVTKEKRLFTWGTERAEWARDSDVVAVTTTKSAFAALHSDGSLKVWGSPVYGGSLYLPLLPAKVKKVYANHNTFVAVLENGALFEWGGSSDGRLVMDGDQNLSDVKELVSTSDAFSVLKNDGTVFSWGRPHYGGDNSHLVLKNVIKLYSNNYAFAALLQDGSVQTWGNEEAGGNSDYVRLTDVKEIYHTIGAFAALKTDGSVVTWGSEEAGGNSKFVDIGSDVRAVYSTDMAFGAIKKDGSAVFWGKGFFIYPHDMEPKNSVSTPFGLHKNYVEGGAVTMFSTKDSFAVLKEDGSVETLGSETYKGNDLSENVVKIYSNRGAFVAFKRDKEPVAWGKRHYGSNIYGVAHLLNPDAYKKEVQ